MYYSYALCFLHSPSKAVLVMTNNVILSIIQASFGIVMKCTSLGILKNNKLIIINCSQSLMFWVYIFRLCILSLITISIEKKCHTYVCELLGLVRVEICLLPYNILYYPFGIGITFMSCLCLRPKCMGLGCLNWQFKSNSWVYTTIEFSWKVYLFYNGMPSHFSNDTMQWIILCYHVTYKQLYVCDC